MATKAEQAEAAAALRAILAAVDSGEIVAPNPRDVALVRRLQGALAALEVAARPAKNQARRR